MDFCDLRGTAGDLSPASVHLHACAFVRLRAAADQRRWALLFDALVIVNDQGLAVMRTADVCAVLFELTTLDTDADDLFYLQHIITPNILYNLMMALLALEFDKTRAPVRVLIARARDALQAGPAGTRDQFHIDANAFSPLGMDVESELHRSSMWRHLTYGMLVDPLSRSMSRAALLEYALCAPRGDGDTAMEDLLDRSRHSVYVLVSGNLFVEGRYAEENAARFARAFGKLAMPAPLESFFWDRLSRHDALVEDVSYVARPTKREEELILARLCNVEMLHAFSNLRLVLHDERSQPAMRSHMEKLLRTAKLNVVFRIFSFEALDRIVRDHAAWLRLPSVSALPVRERVAALCARIGEALESSTFHTRAGAAQAPGGDAALGQSMVSKGSAWATALAEAKATPSCTTLVHEMVQLLGEAPIDKPAVFALLLRGRDESMDETVIVPKKVPAIPPVAILVQAAWNKLDFSLIDRRLQPMTLLLPHLDEYFAGVGAAVAKPGALLPETLDNLRLPSLLEALRRPGKEWGDKVKGFNIITDIYVPVWRRKHSRLAADTPLPSDGQDPYSNMQYLGEALPYLRQLLYALGLPFSGEKSLYGLFKETHKCADPYLPYASFVKDHWRAARVGCSSRVFVMSNQKTVHRMF